MLRPTRLTRGDTIGIIAPASPPKIEPLRKGMHVLKKCGVKIYESPHLHDEMGYLAGSDDDRVNDLHSMFLDPNIKAIFCACGGYGTPRIVDRLDYNLIANNPKIFWGYSDITCLHTSIHKKSGIVTFHGPMPSSDMGKDDFKPLSERLIQQLFEPITLRYDETISPLDVLVDGIVEAPIVGGNLSLLVSSIGSDFDIDVKGKILLIEDIGEEPYRVDGMLNQLRLSGKLNDAAGFMIGSFTEAEPKKRQSTLTLDEVFQHYLIHYGKPVMKGFLIGHCQPHFSIPLGVNAVLNTYSKTLTIEAGVC
ncbi:LD-carboxypeptidase [Terrilactibacillus sp. BCM23-1]|uniref:LD-carboxypeptidase n=1 Tax=Terrilactibacillus tamarindi TaxID=2599694 RepID=A0A6N8CUR7_9BACI|nr:LD-carboxypeptidase [Terrilactibacillus tamarindi]MTT32953.1 LD-carboxypeptidase [Terrilactibacillus tamarindi]